MSWYYSFYIGKKVDGNIELVGPYDNNGKIHPIFETSRSFMSSLKDEFYRYGGDDLEKLENELSAAIISTLPYKDLPKDNFIRSGYFLTDEVQQYLENKDDWNLFYDWMSPEVYAEKLKVEAILGAPTPRKDEEGNEIEVHSCRDYIYFSYPAYHSKEYDAFLIRTAVGIYFDSFDSDDIVIIMGEG